MGKRILVALGGNAILRPGQTGTYQEQMDNIRSSCETLSELVQDGHKLLITHGNGPQVGNLLLQNEAAAQNIPSQPLHSCVAQTQGQMGYMIQTGLDNVFRQKGWRCQTASLITRVLVDANDNAFNKPTKPVGPFFTEEHAKMRVAQGETWMNDSNRGWRRLVPSPTPVEIVELASIRENFEYCQATIAAGGGGIPVVRNGHQLVGVDAVIDKDLASSLLARLLDVDTFVILTDVTNVKINYGKPNETNLHHLSVEQCENYLSDGEFGVGSMAPKVQAAMEFAVATKKTAIITSLTEVAAALTGHVGTEITP